MLITEINYHTLLWIEHLLSARIESSDEHMRHAIKDLIYQIEVVRGLIRIEMEEAEVKKINPDIQPAPEWTPGRIDTPPEVSDKKKKKAKKTTKKSWSY